MSEISESKHFGCNQCGHGYDANPPDELFTYGMVEKCTVCEVLELGQYVERVFECQDCYFKNIIYWHVRQNHTNMEIAKTKAQTRPRYIKKTWQK